jgi:TolB-like protein
MSLDPSVIDAVRCAVAIQYEIAERNADVPEDRRMMFRIGINLCDVMSDEVDIYGDGVNVAARVESVAEPGGICVTASVHDQVRKKLDLDFEDLGPHAMKNMSEPIRIFGFRAATSESGGDAPDARAQSEKPSIAVLPFANMSGDSEQEYFADGVTEDLITALSRIRWFFVIARNSTFAYKGGSTDARRIAGELGVRYMIEGSVRRSGNRVRITAQLIDGHSGKSQWANRYDRDLEDVFALQDELTETIVGAIEPELGKAERARVRTKRPDNMDAWDVYQRGMAHLYRYTKSDLDQARTLFDQALTLDANLGAAYSAKAEAHYYGVVYGHADTPDQDREDALSVATRAVALDDEDAGAHCTLGRVHYMRREHDLAIPELELAIELNPSFALAHYGLGAAMVFSGRAPEAQVHLDAAIRLSPYDPNMGSFLVRMADAHLFMRQHDHAVDWARKALRQPSFQWSRYAVLLSALGHLGRADEARSVLAEVVNLRPDFSIGFVRDTHLIADAGDFAYYLEGLRLAGVPE